MLVFPNTTPGFREPFPWEFLYKVSNMLVLELNRWLQLNSWDSGFHFISLKRSLFSYFLTDWLTYSSYWFASEYPCNLITPILMCSDQIFSHYWAHFHKCWLSWGIEGIITLTLKHYMLVIVIQLQLGQTLSLLRMSLPGRKNLNVKHTCRNNYALAR